MVSRFHRDSVVLLAGCLTSFLGNPALAAPDESELETVIVSATRSAQSDNPTAATVSVITRQMIESSGAKRIDDVLRTAAGVQLADLYGDGSRTGVSLRGFGETAASNVLILVDGRRLNNPDIAAPELSSISLKDVERIEILHGSAGTLYGDQAVGGVINIITRRPEKLGGDIAIEAASYDGRASVARISDRLANGFHYRLSAEKRETDNYRDNNEMDYGNLFARTGIDYQAGTVFLELQTIDEDARLPGGLFRPQYDADRRAARFPDDFADTETAVQRIGLRQAFGGAWTIETEVTHRDSDVEGALSATSFSQARDVKELTPRVIGRIDSGNGPILLTLGADVTKSDYEITSIFGVTTNEQRMAALYAHSSIPVSRRSTLTLGARHARVKNDLRDSFTFPAGIQLDDDVTVAEVGISTRVTDQWRLFLRRDENFRFAKVDEHTATLGSVVGLKTQTGVSYELGAEWRNRLSSFKVVAYRLDLDNEIDFDTTTFANVNLDPTRRNGVVVEGGFSPAPAWRVGGSASFIDAKFRSGPFEDNTVPFVAERSASVYAAWNVDDHWSTHIEAYYIDDRVAAGDISNALEQLDGYTVVNATLRYQRKHWLFAVRINNLTDERYADYAATAFNPATFANETAFYAAPERNFRVTAQYRF